MNDHIRGNGCPSCAKQRKKTQNRLGLTTKTFEEKSKKIHGDLYSYTNTKFKDKRTRIIITCTIHGDFKCLPSEHLEGRGCPSCSGFMTFVEKSRELHADRYNYHIGTYKGRNFKTTITCKNHGTFEQVANEHLRKGTRYHCPICRHENNRISLPDFVARSVECHGDAYNYSQTKLNNTLFDMVKIFCNSCQESFIQKALYHIQGHGCQKCCESKGEKKIRNLLKELKVNFCEQKRFPGLSHIFSLRCDFFIDECRLIIEYDGTQHFTPIDIFGGELEFEKVKKRDAIKNKFCRNNGFHLLRIRDGQNVEEEIKSMLSLITASGSSKDGTIYHHIHGSKKSFMQNF